MIRSTGVHLALFYQRAASFVKFKELLSLLASAYVDLAIQATLQYGAKVAEGMLHLLHIDDS